jgi:hypothetical protein
MLIEPCKPSSRPTSVPAGSERVDVYQRRYLAGEPIFNADDLRHLPERGAYITPSRLDFLAASAVCDEFDEDECGEVECE